MKFLSRHGLWLIPLVFAVSLAALVIPVFVRQATQRRIAAQLVGMGCNVKTRFDGPKWLYQFASEECAEKFRASHYDLQNIHVWAPEWFRNLTGTAGFDALMRAEVTVYEVNIRVDPPPNPQSTTTVSSDEGVGTTPEQFPEVLALLPRFSTLCWLKINLRADGHFDLSSLPQSLTCLEIHSIEPDKIFIDLHQLPAGLLQLGIYTDPGSESKIDLRGLQAARNLCLLTLNGPGLDDQSISCLKNCKQLERLSLYESHLTDTGIAQLAGLNELESLSLNRSRLTDTGLKTLMGLKKLTELRVQVGAASEQSIKDLVTLIPDAKITPAPESSPATSRRHRIRALGRGKLGPVRMNGFDK